MPPNATYNIMTSQPHDCERVRHAEQDFDQRTRTDHLRDQIEDRDDECCRGSEAAHAATGKAQRHDFGTV